MFVVPLIERKRDVGHLTPEEWTAVIAEYTAGRVPDYQMSALLMAVVLNGLEADELAALTDAMLGSGQRLDFGRDAPPRIDKHSTGGVGDKVTLVLAPLVASLGVLVPTMSGRGLGHTGGTADKLEAIPGFRTRLPLDRVRRQVLEIGCAMIAQSPEIAPADQKLYALRDVTGTVPSIPLIAASIMSKKLAEDLTGLVLDVKCGSGAFLPAVEDGLELAQTMIGLGEARGCGTVALVTAMDRPLGSACGNALETAEAIAALRGDGPIDLMEVVYALGTEMLMLGGTERDPEGARRRLEGSLGGGQAAECFRRVIKAQGGDPRVVDDPSALPRAPVRRSYDAPRSGYVARVEPRAIGRLVVELGGGRKTLEDAIDPAVGVVITARPGHAVELREPIAMIHARDEAGVELAHARLAQAIQIIDEPPPSGLPLVSHRVTRHGVEKG